MKDLIMRLPIQGFKNDETFKLNFKTAFQQFSMEFMESLELARDLALEEESEISLKQISWELSRKRDKLP